MANPETVKVVLKDHPRLKFKIINKDDLTSKDKIYKEPDPVPDPVPESKG